MSDLVKKVREAHRLVSELRLELKLPKTSPQFLIAHHVHYEVPQFSVFRAGDPENSVDFKLLESGDLAVIDGTDCLEDINIAKDVMRVALGIGT